MNASGLSRRSTLAIGLGAALAACTTAPTSPDHLPSWRGRLALRIDGTPQQRWQASFVLRGSAQLGQLQILSPLGTTMAMAKWNPRGAWVQRNSEIQDYADTAAMTEALTGARIPLTALYAWLRGEDPPIEGWQIQRPSPRLLVAQRRTPTPAVELRIILTAT